MHPDEAVPTTVAGQLKAGFTCFRIGASTVLRQPLLWPYVFVPALLTLTALVLALSASFSIFEWTLGGWLTPAPGASALWAALLTGSRWALRFLLVALCGLAAYLVAGLIAVPFNDQLSSTIEAELIGTKETAVSWPEKLGDLWMSLRHTAAGLLLWAVCMAVLFLLNLLPGIGSVVGTVASVGVSSLLLARETMDGCMSRRRLSFRHKLRVVRANVWLCLGLGMGAWLFMWIPLMNFLVLPMAVVGGTRMFCWLERQQRIPAA